MNTYAITTYDAAGNEIETRTVQISGPKPLADKIVKGCAKANLTNTAGAVSVTHQAVA